MSLRDKELAEAVYGLLDTKDRRKLARAIAAYLLDTRQSGAVGTLVRDLKNLRYERDSVLEADVTSVRSLSEATKKSIKALFDVREVVINEEHDPSLLGGVKVRAHDMQLDTSVRTRLQRLRAGV